MLIRKAKHQPNEVQYITYEDFKAYWTNSDDQLFEGHLPLLWVKALAKWTINEGENLGHFYFKRDEDTLILSDDVQLMLDMRTMVLFNRDVQEFYETYEVVVDERK